MSFSQRFHDVSTGFERPFWVANISELFERLSYYAAFGAFPQNAPPISPACLADWSGFWQSSVAPSRIGLGSAAHCHWHT